MGCAARSRCCGPFPRSLPPNPAGTFRCTGLSGDLCRVRDGVGVDVVMAGGTDDECLAPHLGHEPRPRGLARSWPAEVGEPGDLVNGHRCAVLAELASSLAEPVDQLLARDGDRDRDRVADDRAPVACEGYPAESRYQIRLARALLPSLKAGPQSVSGDDLGFVACRGLGDGRVVLGG